MGGKQIAQNCFISRASTANRKKYFMKCNLHGNEALEYNHHERLQYRHQFSSLFIRVMTEKLSMTKCRLPFQCSRGKKSLEKMYSVICAKINIVWINQWRLLYHQIQRFACEIVCLVVWCFFCCRRFPFSPATVFYDRNNISLKYIRSWQHRNCSIANSIRNKLIGVNHSQLYFLGNKY